MEFLTLEQAISYFAKTTPDKTCLIEAESGDKLTYSEFWNHIIAFSMRLKHLGLQKGDRVVVRVTQKIDTLIAAFGVHMAGGIYVPIAQKIGEERIKEHLKNFDARFYIAINPVDYDCVYIDINAVYDVSMMPGEGDVIFPGPDDIGDIIFTTGTTGTPKGVMRSHGGYVAAANGWLNVMEFSDKDVFLSCHSQNLIGGINAHARAFLLGASSIVGASVIFLEEFFRVVEKYSVTTLALRPAELTILLNSEDEFKRHCRNIRVLHTKSASAIIKDFKMVREISPNIRLFSNYSSTEVLSICSYDISKYGIKPLCIGKPFPGASVRIVDEKGAPLQSSSYDNPGIISCKAPSMMLGYWNNPELTASVLKDGWLMLTDLGYMDDDGFFYIMGRRDEVINSGGHKIAPAEIEEIALEIDGVKECACVSEPDKIIGSVPKLYVVINDGFEFSAKKIYEYLSSKLENYKLPRTIEQIDVLPRTEENMKVRKGSFQK